MERDALWYRCYEFVETQCNGIILPVDKDTDKLREFISNEIGILENIERPQELRIKDLEESLLNAIHQLIKHDEKFWAIKLHRTLYYSGLKEAKDWVESRVDINSLSRVDQHNRRLEDLEHRVKLLESVQFPGPDNF